MRGTGDGPAPPGSCSFRCERAAHAARGVVGRAWPTRGSRVVLRLGAERCCELDDPAPRVQKRQARLPGERDDRGTRIGDGGAERGRDEMGTTLPAGTGDGPALLQFPTRHSMAEFSEPCGTVRHSSTRVVVLRAIAGRSVSCHHTTHLAPPSPAAAGDDLLDSLARWRPLVW